LFHNFIGTLSYKNPDLTVRGFLFIISSTKDFLLYDDKKSSNQNTPNIQKTLKNFMNSSFGNKRKMISFAASSN